MLTLEYVFFKRPKIKLLKMKVALEIMKENISEHENLDSETIHNETLRKKY